MSELAIPAPLGHPTSLVDYDLQVLNQRYLTSPSDGKGFHSSKLRARLGNLPERTFMAIGEQFNGVNTGDETLSVNAYEVPEFAKGRQESQWEVWFAEVVFKSKSQSEHAELVALKPTNAAAAAHEYHATEVVAKRLGAMHDRRFTFENLGFFFDAGSHKVNRVTRYEHGVQSADGVMWSREDMPAQGQVIDVMQKAAETLAVLHAEAGVAHGDPQPKNIAYNTRGIRIIDLEEATDLLTPDGDINLMKSKQYIGADMRGFLLRLGGDYTDLVGEHFAQPYTERVAESGLLPRYVQLSVEDIREISREPQQSIPYLGPRY